ncbi:uncharacterized protein LOC128860020 isoform X2 [Anastrepha ludens]|uniref:uncharacterized protein LOC128860020 isoform X2 n=1 Tax=Anastrepha ludens TaxID=28586 RepID=UPI0023B0CDF5|nr:uncharacterized protein LOC128860020 isoform X2 [Anastrepha ludens]
MSNQCKDLDKLSTDRKWDDVFHCLKIDVNSTIELGNLKVSQIGEQSDKWLDDYKATMNSLVLNMFCNKIYTLSGAEDVMPVD